MKNTFLFYASLIAMLGIGVIVLNWIVKLGCRALLYIFQHPLEAIVFMIAAWVILYLTGKALKS